MFKVGVSIRTLRHYDEIGLFTPAVIEASCSYRLNAVSQLAALNRVVALKELGLGLSQIDEVSAVPTTRSTRELASWAEAHG